MDANRRTALIAGTLFIAATAASLAGTAIEPVLTGNYLVGISESMTRVSAGGLLELVAAGASAGIAIALYPVLRNSHPALALGAVAFRSIEAAMYTVAAVSLLSLLNVAGSFTRAAGADRASVQAVGDALLGLRSEAVLAGVFAFVLGALMYYAAFYQSRLVPRWLSAWGIAGAMLLLLACVTALFTRQAVTSYTVLIIPIAIQEMAMAVWLLTRGFRSPVLGTAAVARLGAA